MPLLPEKHLLVSPQLAATLGLEEALLYQLLGELMALGKPQVRNNFRWLTVESRRLAEQLPFWQNSDVRRVLKSLRDKGVLLIGGLGFGEEPEFHFAFNETVSESASTPPTSAAGQGLNNKTQTFQASKLTSGRVRRAAGEPSAEPPGSVFGRGMQVIDRNWQPEPDLLQQLAQYGIPHRFTLDQVPEFVTYWQERGTAQHSWSAKFLKHVLHLWRQAETRSQQLLREVAMVGGWRPSRDAIDILTRQAGINSNFVEDAIPEFILYWQERGEARSTWNSDFVRHVKRQWARFTSTLENDTDPHPLPGSWHPSEDLFEVLRLANIPRSFAEKMIPEFILFWRDNGQACSSWNTKFLQHIKRQWAQHSGPDERDSNERRKVAGQPLSTRHRSLVDDLTDRSWAG